MKTVVFIKQVPDTTDVVWTKDNNIDRANTDCVINPADLSAAEFALRLNAEENVITAVTMGPQKASSVLKEVIASGVANGVLLCDSKFAGSDTCATSRVLAKFIKEKFSDADLLLFGQSAADGETGQTGPAVAARLDLPFLTRVKSAVVTENKELIVTTETEEGKEEYKVSLPAVLCIDNSDIKPENPGVDGYIKAHDKALKTYNLYELSLSLDETGIKGSPTQVYKVFGAGGFRNCDKFVYKETPEKSAEVAKEIIRLAEG